MLNSLQRGDWERDGYVVLEGFSSPAECRALRERAAEIVDAYEPGDRPSVFQAGAAQRPDTWFLDSGDKVRCFLEAEARDADGTWRVPKTAAVNKIGHALHDLDPVFNTFCRTARMAALAADLAFRDPRLLQSMYIFKQPGIGGEVGWHQDATYLYTEPPSVVGFWFALQDATLDNGCLRVLPGGHRSGLKARFRRTGTATGLDVLDPTPWHQDGRALPVSEGTLVILHGLLPHSSAANRSAVSRHAFTLHLVEADAAWAADNWVTWTKPLRGFVDPG